MKYQFCIRFNNIDVNSAASKAVLDCNNIFLQNHYQDFTFTVPDNSKRAKYYIQLLKTLLKFFRNIKPGSTVAVQYPLLSINNVFKYFIRLARLKRASFVCIVHDIPSLRTGGDDIGLIRKDITNLNQFNRVIVHNPEMLLWLKQNGFRKDAVTLGVFDYLSDDFTIANRDSEKKNVIVYAGNLVKSNFVYDLNKIKNNTFRLYGPGYNESLSKNNENVSWMGEYSPEQIAKKLEGDFGLIWDGANCTQCDGFFGNYLKYNAPHKFSLYITAGLPVIAPASSAVGVFIKENNLGVLVNSLQELETLTISKDDYALMKIKVLSLRKKIINGDFFSKALLESEIAAI